MLKHAISTTNPEKLGSLTKVVTNSVKIKFEAGNKNFLVQKCLPFKKNVVASLYYEGPPTCHIPGKCL